MVTRCLRVKKAIVLVYSLNHSKEVLSFAPSLLCFGSKRAMRNKSGVAAVTESPAESILLSLSLILSPLFRRCSTGRLVKNQKKDN